MNWRVTLIYVCLGWVRWSFTFNEIIFGHSINWYCTCVEPGSTIGRLLDGECERWGRSSYGSEWGSG